MDSGKKTLRRRRKRRAKQISQHTENRDRDDRKDVTVSNVTVPDEASIIELLKRTPVSRQSMELCVENDLPLPFPLFP